MYSDDFIYLLVNAGAIEEDYFDGNLPGDVNADEWGDPIVVGKATLWEETV